MINKCMFCNHYIFCVLFTFYPELFVERAFDPHLSRPYHRLDSNAKLVGIQGQPLDGALTTKSDFTGVTLTTRIQDCYSVCWFIKSENLCIKKRSVGTHPEYLFNCVEFAIFNYFKILLRI